MALNPSGSYVNITPPDGDYPYGSARNVTVQGDGTGTPTDKNWLNDMWGLFQQLLTSAGIVPSGVPDVVGTSQYHDAMRRTAGYPGVITPVAFNADPATLGIRILKLSGQGVLIANYPELVSVTYVGDPNNASADGFYKADDAAGTVRNTAGTYFILPNAEGRFVRGVDPSGSVDPTAGRLPGNEQNWQMREHAHEVGEGPASGGDYYEVEVDNGIKQASAFQVSGNDNASGTQIFAKAFPLYESTGANLPPGTVGNDELRPVNIAFDLGVWY